MPEKAINHAINEDRDALVTKASRLIKKMSLEEKVGQMTQITITSLIETDDDGNIQRPLKLKDEEAFLNKYIGSVLNVPDKNVKPEEWRSLLQQIHDATSKTRNNIPVIYGIDSLHGANFIYGATLFPQQIGLAATWNKKLAEKQASITALETRAAGIPWNFSPVLDVARNPLWPRIWETFGEDVHLTTELGKALMKGYQKDTLASAESIATCLKHFIGYGNSISGKDRSPAWIPERFLREYFLPPFESAIKAGAPSIMINSSEINGIPVHADKYLLTDLLRQELGFNGVLLSDWQDITYLHTTHRITKDNRGSVKVAVNAGVDMCMAPFEYSFTEDLISLVEDGEVNEERIDEAVTRILVLKYKLGLFDNPMPESKVYESFGSKESADVALETARESITLLNNKRKTLPLPKDAKILITGPAANSLNALNGGWTHTWQGKDESVSTAGKQTVAEALIEKGYDGCVTFVKGCSFKKEESFDEALQKAEEVDYIVVCVGEEPYAEHFGNIHDLKLDRAQNEYVHALSKTGKPVILVVVSGRPRRIHYLVPHVSAVLMAYLPGDEGGKAIAEILFGDANPCGKLPFTYPKYANNLLTYEHKTSDEGHLDSVAEEFQPQFEFGHGLSYTRFEYFDLSLNAEKIALGETIEVSVMVTNVGKRTGKEVVQLYVRDEVASITPPVKKLKAFKKLLLEPGQSYMAVFELHTDDLAFVGRDNKWITEPGTFKVMVGGQEASFEVE
ncbi:glycoside hydrolase family 3 N-terminal domain-containing protein [Chondrinema litorale]|uniref:glycoside hydrolase family 3 N-terminal domain-containing protein n=1 Tax=Chondrinema litorale TaxID=2994555 RepID=UPI002543F803|nr:glycoside hydrolase family 3 N-terminal domain-containing protein [Chondrinema litorale]UZR94892.1 glycoside hydrolase family 3 C-terminal domain-containing protein [Chondrinema litorale]